MAEEKTLNRFGRNKEDVVTVEVGSTARQAAQLLEKSTVDSLVVIREGKMVGMITERDLVCRILARGLAPEKVKVEEIMTKMVTTVDVREGIGRIFEVLKKTSFPHLPILDNGRPVGMVSPRDLFFLLDR